MNLTELTGVRLSPSEIKYVHDGVRQGIRRDGRNLIDLRHLQINTGLLPQANGSARIRTMLSGTDVLCGVKFEVGSIDEASLNCTVELGSLARADLFGQAEATKRAERRGVELADMLSYWLEGTIQLPSLISNRLKWITFIDCEVFGDGGNLQDIISLATYCALRDARLPATLVNEDETDFELNPDFDASIRLFNDKFALTCSCWSVNGILLADPTPEEEACSDCAICVSFSRSGNIRSISKIGGGVIEPKKLEDVISITSSISKHLIKFVDNLFINQQEQQDQVQLDGLQIDNNSVCLTKSFN